MHTCTCAKSKLLQSWGRDISFIFKESPGITLVESELCLYNYRIYFLQYVQLKKDSNDFLTDFLESLNWITHENVSGKAELKFQSWRDNQFYHLSFFFPSISSLYLIQNCASEILQNIQFLSKYNNEYLYIGQEMSLRE